MKKIVFLFPAVLLILLFSSCQKDVSGGDPITTTDKVKTYTEDLKSGFWGNYLVTFNLSYDASDRITSMISTSNPGDKFVFAYPSPTNFSLDIFASNSKVIHEDVFLNSKSYPDSSFQYNNTGDTMTVKRIYDINNQLVTEYEYNYSKITGSELENTITYTYDGNGNLLKATDTDTNVETYEYYPDLVYISPVITPFTHPKKLNLVKKYTLRSNGFLVDEVNHTYTFDSKNRISTEKAVSGNGDSVIKTFTYF